MKKLLFVLFLLIPMTLTAQVINWKHFDQKTMNIVLRNKVSDYVTTYWSTKGTTPTNQGVSDPNPYEAFNKVHRKDVKTYQELADKCIEYWKHDIGYTNTMSLVLWSTSIQIESRYKKINQTVYVWLTSRS